MIRWFRGRIEADYVGTTAAATFAASHPAGQAYRLRIYRASVRDIELIAPPAADAAPADASPAQKPAAGFRQAEVAEARVAGLHRTEPWFYGPVFDLRVADVELESPFHHDGRAYGRLTGTAVGYCELPPEPLVELEIALEEAEPLAETQRSSRELTKPAPGPAASAASQVAPLRPLTPEDPFADVPAARESVDSKAPKRAPTKPARDLFPAAPSSVPYFALSALVALVLWVRCGAQPALLWTLFMLPTLLCRRFLHGVLRENTGTLAIGITLVAVQLACMSVLFQRWWSSDCKELTLLPVIGAVAVVFPAGLLPSQLPFASTALGLALMLSTWCRGSDQCGKPPPAREPAASPSVEHPGVPRTNDDGSWPRRPPGR